MPMSTSTGSGNHTYDVEAPLLNDNVVEGSVDFKGRPAKHLESGEWKSAYFIIGSEMAERSAYHGISSNLIHYLTGPLHQSTAKAAVNVNVLSGMTELLPLLSAFMADSFLGPYRTIIITSILYVMGLGLLTVLASLISSYDSDCQNAANKEACSPPKLQVILFFFSLYVIAFAQGGRKPCSQAFGADQFDEQDPNECKAKSSFFNWWMFFLCVGDLLAISFLNYIQDNVSWILGFGIPCIVTFLAVIVFLLGTTTYRFQVDSVKRNPFVRIGRVFVNVARNWRNTSGVVSMDEGSQEILPYEGSQQFKFLNKALYSPDSCEDGQASSINDIEQAKAVLRLVPIWASCLVYPIILSQSSTLFTKQGTTMDRHITSTFQIPAASVQTFITLSLIIFVPVYDRILVPIARAITRKPSGISMLQRIGIGIFVSLLSMMIAAIVERKRLETAIEYRLVDMPNATVPMKVWWLIPQYFLFGLSCVFTMTGLQEFFYDQVPVELKSIGLALYHSIFGFGNLSSSFLVSVIEKATRKNGEDSWFSDNTNRAHFDYFYWVLTGLSAVSLMAYIYFAKSYICIRKVAV